MVSEEFTVELPPSLGLEDYPEWKEERDSKAVKEFLEAGFIDDIMKLK